MPQTIDIFNWKNTYYGPLSNHYPYQLTERADRYTFRYRSVTNYIYANMLDNTDHISRIASLSDPMQVKNLYVKLFDIEIKNTIRDATERGYEAKLDSFPELKQLLLKTGNNPILYQSQNPILGTGIGSGVEGENLVGMILTQQRHNLLVEKKNKMRKIAKENKDRQLYLSYVVYLKLIQLINDGNNLIEFIGKTPEEIIEILGGDEVLAKAPGERVILEDLHYRSKALPPEVYASMLNLSNIAWYIRSIRLEAIKFRTIAKIKDIILDTYLRYCFPIEYPNNVDEYESIRDAQFATMSNKDIYELKENLYQLYMENKFPIDIVAGITERIESLQNQIPSDEEIQNGKKVAAQFLSNVSKDIDMSVNDNVLPSYIIPSGDPIEIYPNISNKDLTEENFIQLLAPVDNTSFFQIDNLYFPTISHYITYRLLSKITKNSKISYDMILSSSLTQEPSIENFKSPDTLGKIYDITYKKYISNILPVQYMKQAQNIKYSDRNMQNILLSTEDLTILWGDRNDYILGTGNKYNKGENICGIYLMELRASIRKNRGEELYDEVITEENINTIIEYDSMLLTWIERRVKDMANTIDIMNNHLTTFEPELSNYTIKDPKYIAYILDIIYLPCLPIFSMSDDIKINAPSKIENAIRSQLGYNSATDETIDLIWKRNAVLIYQLLMAMQDSGVKKIKTILYSIEKTIENDNDCFPIMLDEKDNCMANALLRLGQRILLFDKQYLKNTLMESRDLVTAASIILQVYLPQKILTYKGRKELMRIGRRTIKSQAQKDVDIVKLTKQYVKIPKKSKTKKTYKRPRRNDQPDIKDDIEDIEEDVEDVEEDVEEDFISEDFEVVVEDDIGEQQDMEEQDDDFMGLGYADSPKESVLPSLRKYMLDNVAGVNETNVAELIDTLLKLIDFLKKYKKIPMDVKHNRIMFFAKI